jgi:hypothetical protein
MINNVFYKPPEQESPEESNQEDETRECSYPTIRNQTTCPEIHKHDARNEVVHPVTGKLSPRGMTPSSVLPHSKKSVTSSHHRFFNVAVRNATHMRLEYECNQVEREL